MTQELRREPLAGEAVVQASGNDLFTGVVGLFEAPHAANAAFEVLLELGYRPDEVGILIAESTKRRFYLPSLLTHPLEHEESAQAVHEVEQADDNSGADPERLAVIQGTAAASVIGALGGFVVAGAAAVLVPGLGLLMIGPLAGLGAGFGAMIGGVYAVPVLENEHARQVARYEADVKAGLVLIAVKPHNAEHASVIRKEWDRLQAESS